MIVVGNEVEDASVTWIQNVQDDAVVAVVEFVVVVVYVGSLVEIVHVACLVYYLVHKVKVQDQEFHLQCSLVNHAV